MCLSVKIYILHGWDKSITNHTAPSKSKKKNNNTLLGRLDAAKLLLTVHFVGFGDI